MTSVLVNGEFFNIKGVPVCCLPKAVDDITSASSLTVFSAKLKTIYFSSSVWTFLCSLSVVVLAMVVRAVVYLDHLNNCYVMLELAVTHKVIIIIIIIVIE